MGRAMLIIVTGVLVSMGYIGMAATQQARRITQSNAGYAEKVHARNVAQTAIQIAMNNINADPDWDENNATENNPWNTTIEDASVELYVQTLSSSSGGLLDTDTLRIVSKAAFASKEHQVVSVYERSALHYVPKFKSAISLATNQFNFSISGNANVNGNDPSGGQCPDMPGISVMNSSSYDKVDDYGTDYIEGNPQVQIDPDLSYSPVDELIARLEVMAGVHHLSGNYKGTMGDSTNPGVFFIDSPTKLTGGIEEGYGIMVIRTDGELQYEGDLDVAGNFTFNGLVIFENAWNFDGKGTPAINGSVLVGNTTEGSDLTVDLNGTIDINYDCRGEVYAQLASANLLNQNRYRRMTTFE